MPTIGELLYSVSCAGSAAVLTCSIVHPIDVVKTRVQITNGTIPSVVAQVYGEGMFAFWKGITAAWMREASYTSLRLGLYKPIKHAMGADKPDSWFVMKLAAGGTAGALGSLVGNPFDLMKTKMMAQTSKEMPKFSTTFMQVWKSEGIMGFYGGLDANISRAVVNNATKMACYDSIKQVIRKTGWFGQDGLLMQAASSFVTGFVLTCAISPFDMVRTQLMNQPTDQPRMYKGMVDCALKLTAKRGPLALWTGFFPLWFRVAPNATIQLILFEQITAMTGGKTI